MSKHYDALETRNPAEREAALMAALPAQIAHAQKHASAFATSLAGVNAASVTSREALAQLPVIRKYELLAQQQAQRAANVFGGFSAIGFGKSMPRVFASPGTIYEPEGAVPITGAWRVPFTPQVSVRVSLHTTASAITSRLRAR